MRTPRGAHYGLVEWLYQRVSAVVMLVSLLVFLVLSFGRSPGYAGWQAFMETPTVRSVALFFFAMVYIHVWTGLRNVVMDYVHSVSIKIVLYTLIAIALAAYSVWTLRILGWD